MIQHIHRFADGMEIRRPMRFVHHSGLSRFRPRLDIIASKLDQFAELLAEGLSVTEAAQRLGHEYAYGNAMLQRIRAKLGPQAR